MGQRRLPGVAWAQGVYWLLTGIWPFVHMGSFLAVSGPKHDLWLVKTVGLLIAVIGGVLVAAARSRRVTPEIAGLGIASAAALTAIDVFYALKGVIWKTYLLDAAAELALIGLWLWAQAADRRKS